ncbi:hypothetical protein K449DRAFT_433739 [Hypoxylon sp. EC38]|nr:hypothetical protein K449DRAFT_433739 [Hypoxylon sp. EC38]
MPACSILHRVEDTGATSFDNYLYTPTSPYSPSSFYFSSFALSTPNDAIPIHYYNCIIARVKKHKQQIQQQHKRTTWTHFRLPRGQDWPIWSTAHLDAHLGHVAGVAGCQKVWLGRKVEDLWESVESLNNFQDPPACDEVFASPA